MSTLYIYAQCKITRDRNCKVDDIQYYLGTIRRDNWTFEVQYQQIELHKTIKLAFHQAMDGRGPFNYLEIRQNSKSFYYFIDKANWKSTDTIEFELTLDTVNTFASEFSFNKKTRILRQHKDRLERRDNVEQNWDVWEYVPANKDIVLNPWAWENEVADTFYVRWGRGDIECSITKYHNGKADITYNDVISIEQAYVGQGQRAVAMTFAYYDGATLRSVILEYDTLISDFNNSTYWVIKFVGNVSDLVYSPNDHWQSLFWGYYSRYFLRKIDDKEEGLNPPLFKYAADRTVHSSDNIPWNLVYMATQEYDEDHPENFTINNPLECYLYPSQAIDLPTIRSEGTEYSAADFTEGTYYYFLPRRVVPEGVRGVDAYTFTPPYFETNYKALVSYDGTFDDTMKLNVINAVWHNDWNNQTVLDTVPYWFSLIKSGDFTTIKYCHYVADPVNHDRRQKIEEHSITLLNATFKIRFQTTSSVLYVYTGSVNPSITNFYTYWNTIKDNTKYETFNLSNTVNHYLRPIPESLKTDSRIMKIIQLPYCPLGKFISNNQWVYDINGWTYDSSKIALKKVNIEADTLSSLTLEYNPLHVLKVAYNNDIDIYDLRDDVYESKCYNSEFYTPKFVYDSFAYTYQLENVNISDVDNLNKAQEIDYKVSNTFSGDFLFGMNVPLKRSVNDYDNIMIVNRNNELPVYTSAFMNYVRTGYNWDVKNKELQLGKSLATTGISTAGGILGGLAMGAMTGSSTGPIGAAIGAAVGLAGGLISLAFNQAQADNNIKQKLQESSRQGVSVSNCDDINLLQYYTQGNKAKQVEYQASTKFMDIIKDLFYYCGYSDDVRAVPELTTRTWFNYIQCEPVFNEQSNLVYKEYLDDIKQRYQEGVTVYHKVNDTYDWDQVKENWETSLL